MQPRCVFLLGFGLLALAACAAQTESVEKPPADQVADFSELMGQS